MVYYQLWVRVFSTEYFCVCNIQLDNPFSCYYKHVYENGDCYGSCGSRSREKSAENHTFRDSLDQDLLEGPMECRTSSQANSLGEVEKPPFNQFSGCCIYTVGHNFVECCLNKACFCWSMHTYHRFTVAFYFVSSLLFFVLFRSSSSLSNDFKVQK